MRKVANDSLKSIGLAKFSSNFTGLAFYWLCPLNSLNFFHKALLESCFLARLEKSLSTNLFVCCF